MPKSNPSARQRQSSYPGPGAPVLSVAAAGPLLSPPPSFVMPAAVSAAAVVRLAEAVSPVSAPSAAAEGSSLAGAGASVPHPPCITGADITPVLVSSPNDDALPDGLYDALDWVAFSLMVGGYDPGLIADLIGVRLWEDTGSMMRYPFSRTSSEGIVVMHHGEGVDAPHGVHVRIPSSALRVLMLDGTIADLQVWVSLVIAYGGKASRVDLARDDISRSGPGVIDISQLLELSRSGCLSTHFRKVDPRCGFDPHTGEALEEALVCGSRQSESYGRIYDKTLEAAEKLSLRGPARAAFVAERGHHVRVEVEYKGDTAHEVFKRLAEFGLSAVLAPNLRSKLDFKERPKGPGENITRVPTHPMWDAFLSGVAKLRISPPKRARTLTDRVDVMLNQWGVILVAAAEAWGGLGELLSYLAAHIGDFRSRLRGRHLSMIDQDVAFWSDSAEAVNRSAAEALAQQAAAFNHAQQVQYRRDREAYSLLFAWCKLHGRSLDSVGIA